MRDFKIMLEIKGTVCTAVEFPSNAEAVLTGSKMLQQGLYEVGEITVVRVYPDGTITLAAGVPLKPSR